MDRRTFLAASTVSAATLALPAQAEMLDYTDGLVQERLAAGETLFLDFSATWCGTCRAQGRAIQALRDENPAYDGAITFVKVDWDTWRSGMLVAELAIPRRSTLVVLKGEEELGRIVADTRQGSIKELMDRALSAATS
ncbi:MAG: thioredoxin family protein [Pseudomonadota bacterium]